MTGLWKIPRPTLIGGQLSITDGHLVDIEVVERIASRILVSDECWLVQGCRGDYGHVAVENHGRPVYVHRVVSAYWDGPIPDGVVVCHRCDDGACVRPDHLFRGTQLDNIADMRAKGRAAHPPIVRGATHHKATLTDGQVSALRATAADPSASQRQIAQMFWVSQSTVWRLLHGRTRAA